MLRPRQDHERGVIEIGGGTRPSDCGNLLYRLELVKFEANG